MNGYRDKCVSTLWNVTDTWEIYIRSMERVISFAFAGTRLSVCRDCEYVFARQAVE